ncbi:MAG: Uncharacterized protein G01um101418_151 [Parcubacteria group bacterium Gr01-1014_18]|nr:MAG: Uncharacterized protein Greene041636_456 [Parcubacteria group bacterium Greene0416_36]TSC81478.1 MAG: Uncharacterized protein G01um101418_151 [Parcubacteria group bacterium Gr01-1014_18]TSC99076.1 MAG: Uncharacterized protein Greene101420_432 [Parcubacteria group bacterium Greene1014_20]TSD07243.1 MAG: Uncharacterized protein Greene07142_259 [Parcubacteria group bacterium Greene0714_2]
MISNFLCQAVALPFCGAKVGDLFFMLKPKNVPLQKGEVVLAAHRWYWMSQFGPLCFLFLFLVLPGALSPFLIGFLSQWGWAFWGVAGLAVFYLILFIAIIRFLYIWSHTLFFVTNLRIIDQDQQGFFHIIMSEANLERVQDITYRKYGVMETLFDYATIQLRTAGPTLVLDIEGVKSPQYLENLILQAREKRIEQLDDNTNANVKSAMDV